MCRGNSLGTPLCPRGPALGPLRWASVYFLSFIFYLLRERERASNEERGRERQTESQAGSVLTVRTDNLAETENHYLVSTSARDASFFPTQFSTTCESLSESLVFLNTSPLHHSDLGAPCGCEFSSFFIMFFPKTVPSACPLPPSLPTCSVVSKIYITQVKQFSGFFLIIAGCQRWGRRVRKMGEGDQKVATSSYKIK